MNPLSTRTSGASPAAWTRRSDTRDCVGPSCRACGRVCACKHSVWQPLGCTMRTWLLLCVCCLALTATSCGKSEDAVVKNIEKHGGSVKRDEKQPGKPVIEVRFDPQKATDAALKDLKELKQLRELY